MRTAYRCGRGRSMGMALCSRDRGARGCVGHDAWARRSCGRGVNGFRDWFEGRSLHVLDLLRDDESVVAYECFPSGPHSFLAVSCQWDVC